MDSFHVCLQSYFPDIVRIWLVEGIYNRHIISAVLVGNIPLAVPEPYSNTVWMLWSQLSGNSSLPVTLTLCRHIQSPSGPPGQGIRWVWGSPRMLCHSTATALGQSRSQHHLDATHMQWCLVTEIIHVTPHKIKKKAHKYDFERISSNIINCAINLIQFLFCYFSAVGMWNCAQEGLE